jgi:hypothetical protein
MYSIDWNRLIKTLLPGSVRKPTTIALLNALITPVKTVYNQFAAFRTNINEQLMITPQKRILQYWLNQKFDSTEERIEIKDYDQLDTLFIFLESENQPLYLPTFIGASEYDFEVCVPTELQGEELLIRSFLDRYKLATKRYLITYV